MAVRESAEIVVIGAGLSGLAAAYELQRRRVDYVVLEREPEVGGLARTEIVGDFAFDRSIHILFTADPYAAELITRLLGDNLVRQVRESYCFSSGVYTEYPYQANNFGLPAETVADNIVGLVEAMLSRDSVPARLNFEEWIYRTFGSGIAENFMIPYNRRQWAWDLKEMSCDWITERVPMPKLRDVVLGALRPPTTKYGANREFWYPRSGGIEALAVALASELPPDRLELSTEVVSIHAAERWVELEGGRRLAYDRLISSMPLPVLMGTIVESPPSEVAEAGAALKHNTVYTVNVSLTGTTFGPERPMHWVYFPEEGTIFHRISFPHRFSEWMAPAGCSSIQAEISASSTRPVEGFDLRRETLEGLVRSGILTAAEAQPVSAGGRVVGTSIVELDPAYIIYDLDHRENTLLLREYLGAHRIASCGRFGEWEYFNMDHSILSGKAAAESALVAD